jgi:hypothetical protein
MLHAPLLAALALLPKWNTTCHMEAAKHCLGTDLGADRLETQCHHAKNLCEQDANCKGVTSLSAERSS